MRDQDRPSLNLIGGRMPRLFAAFLVGLLVLALPAAARAPAQVVVDKVWSGTAVGFGGVADKDFAYLAYYDADRHMTVARVDRQSGAVTRQTLDTTFAGWDSHNSVTLALDPQGRLHAAGNLHGSALNFYDGQTPQTLDLKRVAPIGRDEDSATYPRFTHLQDGRLVFLYRAGGSGDGVWFANRLDPSGWVRMGQGAIFSDVLGGRPTNAYNSPFEKAKDGKFHIATVWRTSINVADNVAITYAQTADMEHWTANDGRPLALPLTAEGSDAIDTTGPDAGLVNNAQVSVDPGGRPIVAYTKYGPNGTNAVYAAVPNGKGGWTINLVKADVTRSEVRGTGSIGELTRFSAVDFSTGRPTMTIDFPNKKVRIYALDPVTFAAGEVLPPQPGEAAPPLPQPDTRGLANPKVQRLQLRTATDEPSGLWATWATQGVNNDKPRACAPPNPEACDPDPTDLILVLAAGAR